MDRRDMCGEKKIYIPFVFFAILFFAIFIAEFFIMLFLHRVFPGLSHLAKTILDSSLLVGLLLPVLYLMSFRPLLQENTERRKTEKTLRENEEKYRVLVETSPDCIKLFDTKRRLLFLSKGGLNEHGFRNFEEAKNYDFTTCIIGEDREKFEKAFMDAADGKISTIEVRHTKEGSDREACLMTVVPVKDIQGRVIYIFGVSRDISEIKRLERVKDLLTHMIIHDLNNPLAVISGYIELLKMNTEGNLNQQQKAGLETVFLASQELKRMTGNLLDIKKMEEGKIRLNYEKFDLGGIVKGVVEEMKVVAMGDKKNLSLEILENIPEVFADKELIKRVIVNLIDNAIKFTPPTNSIHTKVFYNHNDSNLYVQIKDEGKGIPKDSLERIFEQFFQIESKEIRRGYGLGLTFCKMAVNAHGGRIWAQSELGKGTLFTFTLPYKR